MPTQETNDYKTCQYCRHYKSGCVCELTQEKKNSTASCDDFEED